MAVLSVTGCDAVRRLPSADDHTKTVEVAVFEGGYGIEWHQSVAAQFNQEHASSGIVIDLWGEPRVSEKIKPRILRGDPPDLIREDRLPIWLLIAAGKLHPFDDVLDRPAPGSDTTWRELFIPGTLDTYTSDGRVYAIPSAFTAWVCWYDARRFRENGWNVPETWEEFVALCDQIKASGTAPLAFQGKYPGYAWWTFITLAQRIGGLAAINRINALEAGGGDSGTVRLRRPAQMRVLPSALSIEQAQTGQPVGAKLQLSERVEIVCALSALVYVDRHGRGDPDPHGCRKKAAKKRLDVRAGKRFVEVFEV